MHYEFESQFCVVMQLPYNYDYTYRQCAYTNGTMTTPAVLMITELWLHRQCAYANGSPVCGWWPRLGRNTQWGRIASGHRTAEWRQLVFYVYMYILFQYLDNSSAYSVMECVQCSGVRAVQWSAYSSMECVLCNWVRAVQWSACSSMDCVQCNEVRVVQWSACNAMECVQRGKGTMLYASNPLKHSRHYMYHQFNL
jgi:ATP-dependent helicase YprA (DUF1998 family)